MIDDGAWIVMMMIDDYADATDDDEGWCICIMIVDDNG